LILYVLSLGTSARRLVIELEEHPRGPKANLNVCGFKKLEVLLKSLSTTNTATLYC
jgi:hypothetical protein